MSIFVNTRILSMHMTGVQRYLSNILLHMDFSEINNVSSNYSGIKGHLWEQLILPQRIKTSSVLWSPSNSGPINCHCSHVVTIHDFATLDYPEWTSKKFNAFYRFILPKLAKSCDAIISISDYTKSRILHHVDIDENKIHVIKNGVDQRFFSHDKSNDLRIVKKKYALPAGRYVLSVSSIEPRKNIKSLLQAWDRIVNSLDDDIYLVLVGKNNPQVFSDAGLSNIPPRVHFTGFVDDEDLVTIYQNSLLFVYLSLYEGFGLPPLEAMAAGIPVITSNTTSIPEVVQDKALTIDPLSLDQIADSIIYLLNNNQLMTKMQLAGIHHAKQFSWHTTAAQTFNLLKSFE